MPLYQVTGNLEIDVWIVFLFYIVFGGYLWSGVSALYSGGGEASFHADPLALVSQLDVTPPVQQHVSRVQVLDDNVPGTQEEEIFQYQ
jgi:hypothetical protein